jgi:hypothetical protein
MDSTFVRGQRGYLAKFGMADPFKASNKHVKDFSRILGLGDRGRELAEAVSSFFHLVPVTLQHPHLLISGQKRLILEQKAKCWPLRRI